MRQDLEAARGKGRDQAFLDRLMLDNARVAAMAQGRARGGGASPTRSAR